MEKVMMPQVGDMMYSSWGYDQTNVDFYRVMKVSEHSVWMQEWSQGVADVVGWAAENVVAGFGPKMRRVWKGEPNSNGYHSEYDEVEPPVFRKKFHAYEDGYVVSMNSYSNAYNWDGRKLYQSHYA